MSALIRALAIAGVLMLAFAMSAQEFPNKGPATQDPSANSTPPRTYEGCVVKSGGKILLTDADNKDYVLVSNTRKLDSYVGQEVQLAAININSGDPSSDQHGIGVQPQGPTTLDVEDIQKVSDQCRSPQTTDKKK